MTLTLITIVIAAVCVVVLCVHVCGQQDDRGRPRA